MSDMTRQPPKARNDNIKQHIDDERERIKNKEDDVVINSDESFPASDPPSWTLVHGIASDRARDSHSRRER